MQENEHNYPCHEELVPSLKRIEGQVRGVIDMIGDRRYCLEIINLSKAIRSALSTVEESVLMKYVDTCFKESLYSGDQKEMDKKIDEIRLLLKKTR